MLTDDELAGMATCSAAALPDVGTITRPAGGTLNTSTGVHTPAAGSVAYQGAMRVRPPTPAEIDILFGDREVTKQRYVGTLPRTAVGVRVDDRLVVTSGSDPQLLGRSMRVTTVSTGSFHIDRRIGLEVTE